MGSLSSDQISVLLYENSLEFVPKIHAYNRTIDGVFGNRGIGVFLHCVQMLFTQQKMTEEGLNVALTNAKNSLTKLTCDYEHIFESIFLNTNTQGVQALQPLSMDDLAKVKLSVAKDFFHRCFSDPSEFVCVVVGSFDMQKMKAALIRHLGAIPKPQTRPSFTHNLEKGFPAGVTEKAIRLPNRTDSLTYLTFPWKKAMDEAELYKMSFTCQVIEAYLRRVIIERMKLSYGIDVSDEFPFYPYLDNPWMTIRFRCDADRVEPLKKLIMEQLKQLQEQGIGEDEIEEIKLLEAGSDEFWLHDNFYWTSMLANYYLWHWDPQWIYRGAKNMHLTSTKINELLRTAISLDNYSVVTANP